MKRSKIVPIDVYNSKYQFSLDKTLTPEDIEKILGFPPNIKDDPDKVKYSWGFKYKGKKFAIWDYKDVRWSAYGDQKLMLELFTKQ